MSSSSTSSTYSTDIHSIATTTLLVIVFITINMVHFYKDEPNTGAEEKVDLEMQSLRDFSMHSPRTIAKNRLNSLATSSTGDISVQKGAASTPLRSPPKFPPPPIFLKDSVGDKQFKLLNAGNVKLNILILVVTLALVAGVVLGVWNISIYYSNKTSHAPSDSPCVDLEARLEANLQAITRLSELVDKLTRSTQDSFTSSFNTSVVNSWSSRPRYTWT